MKGFILYLLLGENFIFVLSSSTKRDETSTDCNSNLLPQVMMLDGFYAFLKTLKIITPHEMNK